MYIIYHYYIFHKYPKDINLSPAILNTTTQGICRFFYNVFFLNIKRQYTE